jgi:hypothetical protein
MSNLKTQFTSKLVSVTSIQKSGGRYIYLATFDNGASSVIRTSNRAYASVTQLLCYHSDYDRAADKYTTTLGPDTDFLFSAKAYPSLGRNEAHRVVVTIKINPGASAPVEAK